MIGIRSVAGFAFVCLIFPGAAWLRAEERMRAGLWEVTTTRNGTPSGASHNTCYSPAMVALANSPAKTLREATEKAAQKPAVR